MVLGQHREAGCRWGRRRSLMMCMARWRWWRTEGVGAQHGGLGECRRRAAGRRSGLAGRHIVACIGVRGAIGAGGVGAAVVALFLLGGNLLRGSSQQSRRIGPHGRWGCNALLVHRGRRRSSRSSSSGLVLAVLLVERLLAVSRVRTIVGLIERLDACQLFPVHGSEQFSTPAATKR